jgi:hypothetical protein
MIPVRRTVPFGDFQIAPAIDGHATNDRPVEPGDSQEA